MTMHEPMRNVVKSEQHGARQYLVTLQCGHQRVCPSVYIRGTLASYRAPFTAPCPQCPKESLHG